MKERATGQRITISLLHATYRRLGGPLEVRDAWLRRAVSPESVEYVVSMDPDDSETLALTEGVPRLVNEPWPGAVTAVRNWNAAAAAAKGDLLFVIADDLFPPHGWDRTLIDMIGRLDPNRTPFAVKVSDSPEATAKMRHPVLSRAFYAKFGLFSPSYRGVYCDNDFTARAFWRSVILDGRSLELEHDLADRQARPSSESQAHLNRPAEYERGNAAYLEAWSRRQRVAERLLVPTTTPEHLTHWRLSATQRKLRIVSNLRYPVQELQRAPRALHQRIVARLRLA